jgi:DNA helicase-2/ATP-dependent DNA helicase PcrA
MEHAEDMEEERRLFYVAMTRAKERLVLSWSQRRGSSGGRASGRPSRFLDEIPAWFKVQQVSERFGAVPRESEKFRKTEEREDAEFKAGYIVRHDKFGRGTVLQVEGVPSDWKLTIRFQDGTKKIMTRYARLTIEG